MASLRDMMAADAADGGVFFPKSGGAASGFNELVTFYPQYNQANKVENVNVIVDRARLEGTREVRGDGVVFNRREGRSLRRMVVITCPASLNVRQKQTARNPDVFKDSDGVEWVVKRVEGRDDDLQDVVCVRRDDAEVRTEDRIG